MALWPVSAFNLLQDNAPISSEKMWPGLYILDLTFTIMDFVGWRPNNLSGHWNTLYGSRIYLIRLGFPSMILISTASANFQGFSHNEHTPDKPYGQNTLFSKRNLSFWKLHFFWGKLYAIGPWVIHHWPRGTRENGPIKLTFLSLLLEKSVCNKNTKDFRWCWVGRQLNKKNIKSKKKTKK